MIQAEFVETVINTFESQGYTKVSVTPAFIGNKAEVTARDSKFNKCKFKVELQYKNGKDVLAVRPVDPMGWIDELAFFDAIF